MEKVASTAAAGCRIEGAQDAKTVILDKAFAPSPCAAPDVE
jgi:hypothetical protein